MTYKIGRQQDCIVKREEDEGYNDPQQMEKCVQQAPEDIHQMVFRDGTQHPLNGRESHCQRYEEEDCEELGEESEKKNS